MAKLKTKIKSDQILVKAKITLDEEISKRELELLQSKSIRGLLKVKHLRKTLLSYSGPCAVSLESYLKKTITKYEFFFIMAQIVDITRKIQSNNLFLNHLILDVRYVYINEMTKEVQFLYIPLLSNHICLDVLGFMEAIIYSTNVTTDSDQTFLNRFHTFLNSLPGFDTARIEAYISKEDQNVAKQIKKNNRGQSGFITDNPRDYYEHYYQGVDSEATGILEEDTMLLMDEQDDVTTLLEEETTILEENQTVECIHYATLLRVVNNECIDINKPVFRIGKERSYVDYFVSDNQAVSRSHADIITRGDRYFIYDQSSTNHTFVNEIMIPMRQEIEIYDGDRLRLANEEFVFHT